MAGELSVRLRLRRLGPGRPMGQEADFGHLVVQRQRLLLLLLLLLMMRRAMAPGIDIVVRRRWGSRRGAW